MSRKKAHIYIYRNRDPKKTRVGIVLDGEALMMTFDQANELAQNLSKQLHEFVLTNPSPKSTD